MKPALFVMSTLFVLAAACETPPTTVNQDACADYVKHMNALPCRSEEPALKVEENCDDSLDAKTAANCDDFFACLVKNATCDGDTFVNNADDCEACSEDSGQ